jgi:hypothetical protein
VKLFLLPKDGSTRVRMKLPAKDAPSVPMEVACPSCGANPYLIFGGNKHISKDDLAYESDGYCTSCQAYVGTIRLEVETLFGLREDEAVLKGRCRVY